eukprot:16451168-Heterocapsa_arctica.AAC.1
MHPRELDGWLPCCLFPCYCHWGPTFAPAGLAHAPAGGRTLDGWGPPVHSCLPQPKQVERLDHVH